ncbi:hypothetical protein CJJ07_000732 [Candidozyma auris]|nr:hypothetical protein CJJ07_000732 [[Candida] auris]
MGSFDRNWWFDESKSMYSSTSTKASSWTRASYRTQASSSTKTSYSPYIPINRTNFTTGRNFTNFTGYIPGSGYSGSNSVGKTAAKVVTIIFGSLACGFCLLCCVLCAIEDKKKRTENSQIYQRNDVSFISQNARPAVPLSNHGRRNDATSNRQNARPAVPLNNQGRRPPATDTSVSAEMSIYTTTHNNSNSSESIKEPLPVYDPRMPPAYSFTSSQESIGEQ